MSTGRYIEDIEFENGVAIVALTGGVTFDTLDAVQREFRAKTKGLSIKNILFDLKDAFKIDTSGIAALVDLLKYMKNHQTGDKIGLINVSQKVDSLQKILKTDPLFIEFRSREEAVASLRQ
jgi:anti-anti-sigma regulatory factor